MLLISSTRMSKTSRIKPFFIYLAFNAIHPYTSPPQRFIGTTGLTKREDNIHMVNENVGEILDKLDALNLSDNTLVIFTSDNGPNRCREDSIIDKHPPAGPWRGYKTGIWEGSTRVPFLARWPGRIPAGQSTDHLLGLTDLLATTAAICGTPLPDGAGPDSVNQLPALLQDATRLQPRPPLVTASAKGVLSIRDGEWKAIFGTKWSGGLEGNNSLPPPAGNPP